MTENPPPYKTDWNLDDIDPCNWSGSYRPEHCNIELCRHPWCERGRRLKAKEEKQRGRPSRFAGVQFHNGRWATIGPDQQIYATFALSSHGELKAAKYYDQLAKDMNWEVKKNFK